MELNDIINSLQVYNSKEPNDTKEQVGWVTWNSNQLKTPFSEGVTCIKNSLTHRYKAFIICVQDSDNDDDDETDLENNSEDDIPMTPMYAGKNDHFNQHKSIPESPEIIGDSDDESIILSSQNPYENKSKLIKKPGSSTANADALFWNSSVRSPSLKLCLEDSAATAEDIHEALTQPSIAGDSDHVEIKCSTGDKTDQTNKNKSHDLPHSKFHAKKTPNTSINSQDTQYIDPSTSINNIDTQINFKTKGIINDQDTELITARNINDQNTQFIEPSINDQNTEPFHIKDLRQICSNMTKKIHKSINDMDTQVAIKTEIGSNMTKNVLNSIHDMDTRGAINTDKDIMITDSEICDFGIKDDVDAPNSPDSTSLLAECPDAPDKALQNQDQNEVSSNLEDPFIQDTQVLSSAIQSIPVHCAEENFSTEDDELTQIIDEESIVPSIGNTLRKISFPNQECSPSDELSFTKQVRLSKNLPSILDLPTQQGDYFDDLTQKVENNSTIERVSNIKTVSDDVVKKLCINVTQNDSEDILDLPTQKVSDDLPQKVHVSSKGSNVKVIPDAAVKALGISLPQEKQTKRIKRLSSTDFREGSLLNKNLPSLTNTQDLISHLENTKSFVTPNRNVLRDSNKTNSEFSFSTPAKIDRKRKHHLNRIDESFNESTIASAVNQLNLSICSPKIVSDKNHYNDTRELEDDLRTPSSVVNVPISPKLDVAAKKNDMYYACTQDILLDLQSQNIDNTDKDITKQSPKVISTAITFPSPLKNIPSSPNKGVSNIKNLGKSVASTFENVNDNFYASTQDVENDLLTQQPCIKEPSFEECSRELLLTELPSIKTSSQTSDSSEIFEISKTPLKRGRKHIISDSELDSPQIHNFTRQHVEQSLSNSDIEDELTNNTEEDSERPIVYRKNVPKKKGANQPSLPQQQRISTRTRKHVDRLSTTIDSDRDSEDLKHLHVCKQALVIVSDICSDIVIEQKNQSKPAKSSIKNQPVSSSSKKTRSQTNSVNSEENIKTVTEKCRGKLSKKEEKLCSVTAVKSIRTRRPSMYVPTQSRGESESERKLDTRNTKTENNKANVSTSKSACDNEASTSTSFNKERNPNRMSAKEDNIVEKKGEKSKKANSDHAKADKPSPAHKEKPDKRKNQEDVAQTKTAKRLRSNSIYTENTPSTCSYSPSNIVERRGRPRSKSIYVENINKSVKCNNKAISPLPNHNPQFSSAHKQKVHSRADATNITEIRTETVAASTLTLKSQPSSRVKKVQKVMCTQIEQAPEFNKSITKLGGTVVTQGGDVLVSGNSKRTVKLMIAVALGIPVVTPNWVQESLCSGMFLDPWNFILKDPVLESRHNFNMMESLRTANPYLAGWVIYLTPKISPQQMELKDVITASGGAVEFINGIVGRRGGNRGMRGAKGTFSITCPEDQHLWPILPRPLVKPEVVMYGSLHHKLYLNGYKIQET